ncbi:MAG: NAD(P)-binding domain-containing protein, partial [Ginsengibacter sp.]
MKIAVLGTGIVGTTIASKLVELNHEVMMGSRMKNNEKALAWVLKSGEHSSSGNYTDAAVFGEIIFNCTNGAGSLQALTEADAANLKGKIIIDVANPLDNTKGMPPSLFLSNTNSLGEEIQRVFPESFVVKTLNTMWCGLMV